MNNRSRSVSRHQSSRPKDHSVSPTRSRSRASTYRDADRRPRSRSRSHRPREQPSSLSKSAGVIAGIGIAALVAHKFWPKSSTSRREEERSSRRGEDGGGRRDRAREEHVSRGRDGERRGGGEYRQEASHDRGQRGYVTMTTRDERSSRSLQAPGWASEDPGGGWAVQDGRSRTQASSNYGRRYS